MKAVTKTEPGNSATNGPPDPQERVGGLIDLRRTSPCLSDRIHIYYERSEVFTLTDIRWAAEECERQESGELSVANLCNALDFARDLGVILDLEQIRLLGQLVEPEKNKRGFRETPVHFFDMTKPLPAHQIVWALTSLINNGNQLSPTEWYTEFEKIHPFIDGNGRVGSILWNRKNGTLDKPVSPPNVFHRDKVH